MRKVFGMFALLALVVPLTAWAAAPMAVPPQSRAVLDSILTPQEVVAASSPSEQLDVYWATKAAAPVTRSGGGVVYPANWVCSISCLPCNGSGAPCPAGTGFCRQLCP